MRQKATRKKVKDNIAYLASVGNIPARIKRDKTAHVQDAFERKKHIKQNNNGLLVDGDVQRITLKQSYKHLAQIAPSGGGKSSTFAVPNIIAQIQNGHSLMVTDLGGGLYDLTSGFAKQEGYRIRVIHPTQPDLSDAFNPQWKKSTFRQFRSFSKSIIEASGLVAPGDPIWTNGAAKKIRLAVAILHGVGDRSRMNLSNTLALLQIWGTKGFEDLVEGYAPPWGYREYYASKNTHEKMESSFLGVAIEALELMGDPDLAQVMSENDIDFGSMRTQKTIVYLIVPEGEAKDYSFLISLAYSQAFDEWIQAYKDIHKHTPNRHPIPVFCIMDEFANLGAISNFEGFITTVRKYDISLSLLFQSQAQLIKNYGPHVAEIILDNTSTKIILPGCSYQTTKATEQMIGKEVTEYTTKDGAVHVKERNLINADRIRTLKEDHAILLIQSADPIVLKDITPFYENEEFKAYTKLPPAPFPNSEARKEPDILTIPLHTAKTNNEPQPVLQAS